MTRARDLPGWQSALDGVRSLYPEVEDAVWQRIGDDAPAEWMRFWSSSNELFVAAQRRGLVRVPLRGR